MRVYASSAEEGRPSCPEEVSLFHSSLSDYKKRTVGRVAVFHVAQLHNADGLLPVQKVPKSLRDKVIRSQLFVAQSLLDFLKRHPKAIVIHEGNSSISNRFELRSNIEAAIQAGGSNADFLSSILKIEEGDLRVSFESLSPALRTALYYEGAPFVLSLLGKLDEIQPEMLEEDSRQLIPILNKLSGQAAAELQSGRNMISLSTEQAQRLIMQTREGALKRHIDFWIDKFCALESCPPIVVIYGQGHQLAYLFEDSAQILFERVETNIDLPR